MVDRVLPLVPIFHQKIFSKTRQNLSIVNIGGISNLTLLIGKEKVFSTDIGPGNELIDDFCCKYFNRDLTKMVNYHRTEILKLNLLIVG